MSKHSLHYVDLHPQALEDAAKPEPLWLSILGAVLITVALACLFMSGFNLWSA